MSAGARLGSADGGLEFGDARQGGVLVSGGGRVRAGEHRGGAVAGFPRLACGTGASASRAARAALRAASMASLLIRLSSVIAASMLSLPAAMS